MPTSDKDVLRRFARRMRAEATPAERKLWLLLRPRRFSGYKFRRQVPLGPFILDFVCLERRLVIEADGSQHAEVHETRGAIAGWPTMICACGGSGTPTSC